MKSKKLLFYLLAALLTGCVPVMSLHPLYTEETIVFEEKLLGTWVDDSNGIWEFKCPNEPEKANELIYSDDEGKGGSFITFLVKLENRLFLDVSPNKFPYQKSNEEEPQWEYNAYFSVPMHHTFVIIDSIEPQLKLRLTDDEIMKEFLDNDPNAIKLESFEDSGFILTASTKGLQAFVLKYADDDRVFSKEVILSRKKTKDPNEPNDIDPNDISKEK